MTETYTLGDTLPDGSIYLGCLNGVHSSTSADPKMEVSKWKDDPSWPTREEGLMLWRLYQKKPELFLFGSHKAIWLSEVRADDSDDAYFQWVDDGSQGHNVFRNPELPVRPVRRFKSFNDLIISSQLLAEIAELEQHTGLSFPELKKVLGVK